MTLRNSRKGPLAIFLCLVLVGMSTVAWAAGPTTATPAPAGAASGAAATPAPDPNSPAGKLAEAKQRYEAGLQLYERGDYDAARVEFERAYQLAPSYRILYNLGLILEQKADYVGALKNFQTYLDEGASNVPDARKAQVLAEIDVLKKRVASVRVTTNVPDCVVLIDDVEVGKTPMAAPVLVNPGRRRVSATKKGRIPNAKVVDVASLDNVTVALELGQEKQVFIVDKPTRRIPWVGWGVTAAFAVGAGITGYVALNATNDLKDARDAPKADPSRLSSLSSRSTTFSVISDVCSLGTLVAGGISLYYTLKWGHEYNEKVEASQHQAIVIRPTPGGVAGTF